MSAVQPDVVVIGSGPAGAQAAKKLVELGLTVWTVDVGEFDTSVASLIPVAPFSDVRRKDEQQARYFIGDLNEDGVTAVKAGAQLTPPRSYVTRGVDDLAPMNSTSFHPMLSLALGGLGSAWGAGAFTFTRAEADLAGLSYEQLTAGYREVTADIGISGSATEDISSNMVDLEALQSPLPLDDNARSIFERYQGTRDRFNRGGFRLGRPSIAMLSEPLERDGDSREANPLFDMDFYSDASRSVYRPRFTIEELRRNGRYRYCDGLLALEFSETEDGVELLCRDLKNDCYKKVISKRLIVAAGAINTARIVARSLRAYGRRIPLLCNPYYYIPGFNLAMLGRPARDERHSLVQLVGTLSQVVDNPLQTFVSFYSYRSLMLHKIVKEMPLPPQLGLLAGRILLSSLTVLGVHFADAATQGKWLMLERGDRPERDVLHAEYALEPGERRAISAGLRRVLGVMLKLGVVPLSVVDPGYGSSIHYAGTLAPGSAPGELATQPEGNLRTGGRVYVADSAGWNFLPAKGPTLTIMAHARTVAGAVARSLGVAAG